MYILSTKIYPKTFAALQKEGTAAISLTFRLLASFLRSRQCLKLLAYENTLFLKPDFASHHYKHVRLKRIEFYRAAAFFYKA